MFGFLLFSVWLSVLNATARRMRGGFVFGATAYPAFPVAFDGAAFGFQCCLGFAFQLHIALSSKIYLSVKKAQIIRHINESRNNFLEGVNGFHGVPDLFCSPRHSGAAGDNPGDQGRQPGGSRRASRRHRHHNQQVDHEWTSNTAILPLE
jgi:hypothetical protein